MDQSSPTERLLVLAGAGDNAALEALYARYAPRLRRWAAGRLPAATRDLADTQDLVQDTLLQTLRRLPTFEVRGEGAFLAYLRRAILNRINNEIRRVSRKPVPGPLSTEHPTTGPSPLEEVLGRDVLTRYERALQELSDSDRHAVIARVEFGLPYEEVARILGKDNAAAARQAVARALRRLAGAMDHGR